MPPLPSHNAIPSESTPHDLLERIVEANAALIGLPLPTAYKAGVVAQLALNARLIAPLLDFDLPDDAQ